MIAIILAMDRGPYQATTVQDQSPYGFIRMVYTEALTYSL
jgi:hypothetical protein